MKTKCLIIVGGMLAILALPSCNRDKDLVPVPPPVPNESEIITTLELLLTDSSGIEALKTFRFRDPDGEGGNAPVLFDTLKLKTNKTYFTKLILLNETVSPADSINKEIIDEANEHLFCFFPSGVNLDVKRTDLYGSFELGLQSRWRTGVNGSGFLKVILKHQPGTKNGSCDPGETDIEINFPLTITN